MDLAGLDKSIRRVRGFPKDDILFYDITGIFTNPEAFAFCIDEMVNIYAGKNFDGIAGVESRGFLFASPLACRLKLPLLLIRKKGKLPGEKYTCEYDLEYGSSILEAHKSDIVAGANYLVVDDLIATGGTLKAAKNLIEKGGGKVSDFFAVIGLSEMDYKRELGRVETTTLLNY